MMAEVVKRKRSSWKLINYRFLTKNAMMIRALENARSRKKSQQRNVAGSMKRRRSDGNDAPGRSQKRVQIKQLCDTTQKNQSTLNCRNLSTDASQPETSDKHSWEVDSGFSSETSPPASGRGSPTFCCPSSVVALDCEMVGTGPSGRCSELARCSIVDYHGNVLFDEYVRPCQPVTDYRTRWSGIQRHHLLNAMPFTEARDGVLRILQDKVVVGHSIDSDFRVLDISHPCHMVRDTSTTWILRQLAGFQRKRCLSLKVLAHKLLNRRIQVGKMGHCSVEDARATLDLYKLVEGEWEQELMEDDPPQKPAFASSDHYMQDEYWPDDVTADSQ
ncbi:apoptosis-enhancing nuclease [Betta splendens]|uniref:Apoptosis-enhancing nuclease n=1 Tax=Betta splendens TaxID=158456 RepID=A0A6P7MU94_BETSP|nr:apoptosis-enhancing nuclease [Betta splendens]